MKLHLDPDPLIIFLFHPDTVKVSVHLAGHKTIPLETCRLSDSAEYTTGE